jgi:hypothetical protein
MSILSDAFAAVKRELGIVFGLIDEPRERFMVTSPDQVRAELGGLIIAEPSGKLHGFLTGEVCDVYVRSLRQQPGKADVLIWTLPRRKDGDSYLDYQEVYAGTFDLESESYDHLRRSMQALGWEFYGF